MTRYGRGHTVLSSQRLLRRLSARSPLRHHSMTLGREHACQVCRNQRLTCLDKLRETLKGIEARVFWDVVPLLESRSARLNPLGEFTVRLFRVFFGNQQEQVAQRLRERFIAAVLRLVDARRREMRSGEERLRENVID